MRFRAMIGGAVMGAVMLVAGACDSERPCTLLASRAGVGVDVRPPETERVESASLRVCWDGSCETPLLRLRPSSTSVPMGCDGDGPDAVCGASASPDGGLTGFAPIAELPKEPVDIVLTLRDAGGGEVLSQRLRVTPEASYPNGRHCPPGEPNVRLTVADGRVTER